MPGARTYRVSMTTDPNIVRRVTRLENEVESLYELIDEFRTETWRRFDQHDARFDQHDARFDQHDARFDRIDATLTEVLRRLPATS